MSEQTGNVEIVSAIEIVLLADGRIGYATRGKPLSVLEILGMLEVGKQQITATAPKAHSDGPPRLTVVRNDMVSPQ